MTPMVSALAETLPLWLLGLFPVTAQRIPVRISAPCTSSSACAIAVSPAHQAMMAPITAPVHLSTSGFMNSIVWVILSHIVVPPFPRMQRTVLPEVSCSSYARPLHL